MGRIVQGKRANQPVGKQAREWILQGVGVNQPGSKQIKSGANQPGTGVNQLGAKESQGVKKPGVKSARRRNGKGVKKP